MLKFLRGKGSDRKLRLFACACCRRVWHLLTDQRSRRAVEVAEQFADGLTSGEELGSVCESAEQVGADLFADGGAEEGFHSAAQAAEWVALANRDRKKAARAAQKVARVTMRITRLPQIDLLRDVFGPLPFHPLLIDSTWLSWNDGIIPKLAQAIYDDRAFDRLPILADALEEAGCTNADILNHCRQPSEHVRGCWVVDLLLGKS
jgi:hypothetical protein